MQSYLKTNHANYCLWERFFQWVMQLTISLRKHKIQSYINDLMIQKIAHKIEQTNKQKTKIGRQKWENWTNKQTKNRLTKIRLMMKTHMSFNNAVIKLEFLLISFRLDIAASFTITLTCKIWYENHKVIR